MKPIDYYTTISEDSLNQIGNLCREQKLTLIHIIADHLNVDLHFKPIAINENAVKQILSLYPNQLLGLIKALCDQLQIPVISK